MKRLLIFLLTAAATGQAEEPHAEQPRDASIRILNACDTSQKDRWRTGLDLTFQGGVIGRDIRLGESGPCGKITCTGKDVIEVFRNGTSGPALVRVPAKLRDGGRYSLVVFGQIEADSARLGVRVIEEVADKPDAQCRMLLLNAIEKFPVAIGINQSPPTDLPVGEVREFVFAPGQVDIGLYFLDPQGKSRRLQAGLRAEPGGRHTAVILPSPERPDRPALIVRSADGS
jgi:hypothetical protein